MKITNKTTIRSESRVSFGSVSAIPDVPQIPAAKKMLSMVPEESETKTEKSEPVTIAETVLIWDAATSPQFGNYGVVGNLPTVVSGGNYGGVNVTQNTLQSMMNPFTYQSNHNMPFVIDVFARGAKLRWGARECALEIRVGNYHVCTGWAPASKMPRWDVYLGPFGVCAQMNERIIISVLGRGQQHGAKILDMLDIPVRKLYNKGCYVKREFGMDRNNCKIQLEVSMKQANRMGGNIMGGGVALPMGHLMAPAYGGMGNVVWA